MPRTTSKGKKKKSPRTITTRLKINGLTEKTVAQQTGSNNTECASSDSSDESGISYRLMLALIEASVMTLLSMASNDLPSTLYYSIALRYCLTTIIHYIITLHCTFYYVFVSVKESFEDTKTVN